MDKTKWVTLSFERKQKKHNNIINIYKEFSKINKSTCCDINNNKFDITFISDKFNTDSSMRKIIKNNNIRPKQIKTIYILSKYGWKHMHGLNE